jgi:hypothetical protein
MTGRNVQFHWHYSSDPVMHHTTLEISKGVLTEGLVKERIATAQGDRCLAQYIVIDRTELV